MLLLLITTIAFAADNTTTPNLYTVQPPTAEIAYLYFQGNVQPLRQYDVLAPISGIVSREINFSYGATVSKGQNLLSIAPDAQQDTYRSALLTYLRAKSTYSDALAKFSGQELLYKNGIVSRNDYTQYQSNILDQKLAMQEAYYNLRSVVSKMNSDVNADKQILDSLANLSINDAKVYHELNRNFNEVRVNAPADGIALLPIRPAGTDSNDNAAPSAVHKDSVLKLNQVVLTIGDFSGLKINVDVSEVSINQVRLGQKVVITGPAFPTISLQGVVSDISYQAKPGSFGNSVPVYPITITVPQLTPDQQKIIHVGMSAQVKIALSEGSQILVPIQAVIVKNGDSYLTVMRNGQAITVPVQTGNTTLDQVEILKGITPGEQIVIAH